MEVHHHAHHEHGKKNWKTYFWEFLMMFLAVFCGFLAENQREHYVEHHREKQYIKSMIADAATDTSNLNALIARFTRKEALLDSVIRGFMEGTRNYSPEWANQFLRSYRGGFPDFYPTDRTIQQLKNAGGLRLIKSEIAAKRIIDYDAEAKDVQFEEDILSALQDRYIEAIMEIWSTQQMFEDAGVTSWTRNKKMKVNNNYWLTSDPVAFQRLFNRLTEFNEALIRQREMHENLKESAIILMQVLKKEYHLD